MAEPDVVVAGLETPLDFAEEPVSCPECEEVEYMAYRCDECWLTRRGWLEGAVIAKPWDHRLWAEYQAFLEDLRLRGDL